MKVKNDRMPAARGAQDDQRLLSNLAEVLASALDERAMLSAVARPPRAKGCSWCSSSAVVARQRTPRESTNVQRASSRSQTALRTAAGT